MTIKTFQLYSHLTKEQADVMLAILVHLHGERVENCVAPDTVVVKVTKEEFESIPVVSHLALTGDEDSGLIYVKLTEVEDNGI